MEGLSILPGMATILAHYGTHFPRARAVVLWTCMSSTMTQLPPEKLHGAKSEVESHSSSKDLPTPWISVIYAVNRSHLP